VSCFVSFRFVSFRFVSFRFVSFRFVSQRGSVLDSLFYGAMLYYVMRCHVCGRLGCYLVVHGAEG
jgi:hypothetical protein